MKAIVKIKSLNEGAVVPFKTYSKDMCYDVVAVSEEEVAPNVWKYGLGFACEMSLPEYDTDKCYSIDLRPRSSIWKTGMVLSNKHRNHRLPIQRRNLCRVLPRDAKYAAIQGR